MLKAFKGRIFSRSSASDTGPPGERVILHLNPERLEKILSLTGWATLEPGTLNLEVEDSVLNELLSAEPLWIEDATNVRYPEPWKHIPRMRKAYLYYEAAAHAHGETVDVLVRRAQNPVPRRVELFAEKNIRAALSVLDGDDVVIGPDSGQELLEEMRKGWAQERRFYSNAGKEERERWVVAEFLRSREVSFRMEELRSPEQAHFVDVEFRDARFQVKEILTPGERRQDEIRAIHERVVRARRLGDTIGPGFAYDTPRNERGDHLVYDAAIESALDPRYIASKAETDLLFYVTHSRASPPRAWETKDWSQLASLGWRSICCLINDQALVLFAAATAPEFLRAVGASRNGRPQASD